MDGLFFSSFFFPPATGLKQSTGIGRYQLNIPLHSHPCATRPHGDGIKLTAPKNLSWIEEEDPASMFIPADADSKH